MKKSVMRTALKVTKTVSLLHPLKKQIWPKCYELAYIVMMARMHLVSEWLANRVFKSTCSFCVVCNVVSREKLASCIMNIYWQRSFNVGLIQPRHAHIGSAKPHIIGRGVHVIMYSYCNRWSSRHVTSTLRKRVAWTFHVVFWAVYSDVF